jgi:hypothetical protein
MEHIILPILCAALAALCVAAGVYFARRGLSARAREILLGLVAEAEGYFGEGTGAIKLSAVLGRLYEMMPTLLQVLFKPATIRGWVEEAVCALKDYLQKEQA